MKCCLIIVDSLRYDETPRELIPYNFKLYKCKSLANTTEPSLTTILSGLPPEKHRITKTGQPNASKQLRNIKLLPNYFKKSFISSPAIIFHPYFTYSSLNKYVEEAIYEAIKYIDVINFAVLHVMDVHDLRDMGWGFQYYKGYEEIPKEVLNWNPPTLQKRPYETDFRTGNAGLLKAKYRGAVVNVFSHLLRFIGLLESSDMWKIIITADHGESFKWWHHDGIYEQDVFEVPLIANIPLEEKEYSHLDIFKMVIG